MRSRPRLTRFERATPWAVVALTALSLACSSREPTDPAGPGQIATSVFELARDDGLDGPAAESLFGTEIPDGQLPWLLDSVAALAHFGPPEVEGIQEIAADVSMVDLRASTPGGGTATFSFQVEGNPTEGFRVTWFAGPGIEWPPPRRRRGEGLSSSPPDP